MDFEIITPLIFNTENGPVQYPILVKSFGGKKGTIIARHSLFIGHPRPKHKDYFFSAVNAVRYSSFDREQFIKTLEDWGYFGPLMNKPTWFKGHVYE